jgi:hypothetical protein
MARHERVAARRAPPWTLTAPSAIRACGNHDHDGGKRLISARPERQFPRARPALSARLESEYSAIFTAAVLSSKKVQDEMLDCVDAEPITDIAQLTKRECRLTILQS